MAIIYDLVRGQDTYRADVNQSVLDVARAMVERNIGAVPVLENGQLVGVFSERDLMKGVVVPGLNPSTTLVSEVMTREPLTVDAHENPETCMLLMRRHGFRHLPVCEGEALVGFLSLRDLLLHDLNEKDYDIRMMRAYIHSTPDM
jgi:CBS domain-containing protein